MAWPGRPCTGGWRGIALTASRAWPTGPCAEQHPWRVSAEIEGLVCELRRAHRRGYPGVSRSTVYRVLVRHQLIEPVSRRRRRDQYIRWERPAPMQLWQLDV